MAVVATGIAAARGVVAGPVDRVIAEGMLTPLAAEQRIV